MVQRQAAGAANGEINLELALLKRTFTLAQKAGQITARPAIEKLPDATPRAGFFEPKMFDRVCEHLPAYLAPVARFAYLTGWRAKAEILPLEWRHVDFESGRVYLEGRFSKNGEPRYFPFKDFSLLNDVITGQKAEHDRLAASGVLCPLVFHRNGARIRDYRKAWESACTAAGCPGRIVHDFRRTAARNFIRAGVSEAVAMTLTGHKTRSIFDRYNITSEADQTEAVRLVGTLLGTPAVDRPSKSEVRRLKRIRK